MELVVEGVDGIAAHKALPITVAVLVTNGPPGRYVEK